MLPLISLLASNGLSLLAGAIQSKGREVIEAKLGIKLPDSGSTTIHNEVLANLKEKEMEHEEFLVTAQLQKAQAELDAEAAAAAEVTARWEADMKSDSYLAKNIRPMTLIFILVVYAVFALLSAAGVQVTPAYVELLGQWGMLIMSAYFVGRTAEKIVTTRSGGTE